MFIYLIVTSVLLCCANAFVMGWSSPAMVSVPLLHRPNFLNTGNNMKNSNIILIRHSSVLLSAKDTSMEVNDPFMKTVLFIECGFGNDSHGQNATKAAVRACRNAIEFNSIPSIQMLVPGGYDGLKLKVHLAVPSKYQDGLDLDACAAVFPYGNVEFAIQDGGMVAPSGISIDSLGDKNDDMVVVCCSVMVGY